MVQLLGGFRETPTVIKKNSSIIFFLCVNEAFRELFFSTPAGKQNAERLLEKLSLSRFFSIFQLGLICG
jgi:hypothetical protein